VRVLERVGGVAVVDIEEMRTRRMKAEQRAHLVREIIETILLTALIFVVVHFAVQTFRVRGPSMEPGLQDSEYLVVNSMAYWFGQPHRGDIIVFHHHHIPSTPADLANGCTADPNTGGAYMTCDYVKRVVAIPGDTVEVTPTQIIVDGVVLNEPYVQVPPGEAENGQIVAPRKLGPSEYFVLGDNRLNSSDSRYWATPLVRQDIVGRVVMVFWPVKDIHWLPNYSSVFAHVHP
jgi:signal peptidase I